jgi:hypothetical protein
MDPWSKVTAPRASDGVTDRPMTSAERMKLHRRRLGLRPAQVIVSQQDIDYLLEARDSFPAKFARRGPFTPQSDRISQKRGHNPTDFECILGGAEIHP